MADVTFGRKMMVFLTGALPLERYYFRHCLGGSLMLFAISLLCMFVGGLLDEPSVYYITNSYLLMDMGKLLSFLGLFIYGLALIYFPIISLITLGALRHYRFNHKKAVVFALFVVLSLCFGLYYWFVRLTVSPFWLISESIQPLF